MNLAEMFGFAGDKAEADSDERDKATDKLSAPAVEEYDDHKLHVERCGMRYYQTRAEIRYARADIKRVRAELSGVRMLLFIMLLFMMLGGSDGGMVIKIIKLWQGG